MKSKRRTVIFTGGVATTKVDRDYPDHHLTGAVFEIWQDVNGNGTLDEGTDILVGVMERNRNRHL